MTKKTKLLVIALAVAAVVIVSLVATVIIMSMGNKPAPVQPKEDPIPSSTSNSNTNISSMPTEDPDSSVPESTPSVPADNSQPAEAVPIDEYPGVFPLDQWGGPIFPNYQVGESIIAYAESLGFSQYTDDSDTLVFYIGGDSWDSEDVRVRVNYSRRGSGNVLGILFEYADGESSTSIQIIVEDAPEWVGGYDDFPDELAEHVALFLGLARSDVYRNSSGSLAAMAKTYQSYHITHITDGVIVGEEQN